MHTFFFTLFFLSVTSSFCQPSSQKLIISPVCKNFYVYTTFGDPGDGSSYPANGLYILTSKGAVLIDTPWDTTQFQPLLDYIWLKHHQKVITCISTHFHADRTPGLHYYQQHGIKTYTTKQTDELSKQRHEPRAQYLIYQDTVFNIGGIQFQTYYPGKGHSPDNIVLWFGKEKVLYGGCFIKSVETDSPGNMSDANTNEWTRSIQKVIKKFKAPNFVITGHLSWKDTNSVSHTLNILRDYQAKQKNANGPDSE